MKWSNAFNRLHLFCKAFNRVFLCAVLCLLLFIALTAFAFDRLVAAEVPRAFAVHVPVADAQLRRGIAETFDFRWHYPEPVHEVFEQEHPDIERFLGRGVARGLVAWCVFLHESSRLDAIANGTVFFDKDAEILENLDSASHYWFNHGLESATSDELRALKEQLFGSSHPAWRSYVEKHPAGDGT